MIGLGAIRCAYGGLLHDVGVDEEGNGARQPDPRDISGNSGHQAVPQTGYSFIVNDFTEGPDQLWRRFGKLGSVNARILCYGGKRANLCRVTLPKCISALRQ